MSKLNCWAQDHPYVSTKCSGGQGISEDYPGIYTYFCDFHGHFEDFKDWEVPDEKRIIL